MRTAARARSRATLVGQDMLRLVTQFDDSDTRPSAATPTCDGCSSCCCCCCCIASTIVTTAYTAMNLRQTAVKVGHEAIRVRVVSGCGLATVLLLIPGIVGVGACIALLSGNADHAGWVYLTVPWPVALVGLYHAAGDREPLVKGGCVWIIGTLLFGLEVMLGGLAVLVGHAGLYLLVALLITVAGLWGAYRLTHD